MIDHISLGSRKFEEAVQFYEDCFAPLGYRLEHRTPEEAAFGSDGRWTFWIYPVAPDDSIVGARCHVAVSADTQNQIRKFHKLAIERGAISVRIPG